MKKLRWDGVAERLSRTARIELLYVLLNAGFKRKDVAKLCGVTQAAVSHWISSSLHHPSNAATEVMLKTAWNQNSYAVKSILRAEANRFSCELEKLGIKRLYRGVKF